jgi:hypothetical protein
VTGMSRIRIRETLRADDGSILPLAIFFGVLALALVLVVVAATSLYLERERLYTVADGAALAGAEAFDLGAVTVRGDAPHPQLRPADVRSAARAYLASAAADGFHALTLESAGSPDGESATVRLAATWHPPMLSLFVPDGIRLRATSTARSVLAG